MYKQLIHTVLPCGQEGECPGWWQQKQTGDCLLSYLRPHDPPVPITAFAWKKALGWTWTTISNGPIHHHLRTWSNLEDIWPWFESMALAGGMYMRSARIVLWRCLQNLINIAVRNQFGNGGCGTFKDTSYSWDDPVGPADIIFLLCVSSMPHCILNAYANTPRTNPDGLREEQQWKRPELLDPVCDRNLWAQWMLIRFVGKLQADCKWHQDLQDNDGQSILPASLICRIVYALPCQDASCQLSRLPGQQDPSQLPAGSNVPAKLAGRDFWQQHVNATWAQRDCVGHIVHVR